MAKVKFLKDYGEHKLDEIVEIPESEAFGLVEWDVVERLPADEEVEPQPKAEPVKKPRKSK